MTTKDLQPNESTLKPRTEVSFSVDRSGSIVGIDPGRSKGITTLEELNLVPGNLIQESILGLHDFFPLPSVQLEDAKIPLMCVSPNVWWNIEIEKGSGPLYVIKIIDYSYEARLLAHLQQSRNSILLYLGETSPQQAEFHTEDLLIVLDHILGTSKDKNPLPPPTEVESIISSLNSLIYLGTIKHDTPSSHRQVFDLQKAVREVVKLTQKQVPHRSIKLNFDSLSTKRSLLIANRRNLEMLLLNLMSNSIKFSDEGDVEVNIQLTQEKGDWLTPQLRISVKDSGIGFPKDADPLRFCAPFKKGTHGKSGAGIGLTVVREILNYCQGEILFETPRSGKGSQVSVILPLEERSAPQANKNETLYKVHTCSARERRRRASHPPIKKALLADDDTLVCCIAKHLLEEVCEEVHVVQDGREALIQWSSGKYDFLVLDNDMPHLKGSMVSRAIRTLEGMYGNTTCPIIIITAAPEGTLKDVQEKSLASAVYSKVHLKRLDHLVLSEWNRAH